MTRKPRINSFETELYDSTNVQGEATLFTAGRLSAISVASLVQMDSWIVTMSLLFEFLSLKTPQHRISFKNARGVIVRHGPLRSLARTSCYLNRADLFPLN